MASLAPLTNEASRPSEEEGPFEEPAVRRFIVLISEDDEDDADLPSRIWSLAAPQASAVVLVGLYPEEAEHAHVRRALVCLASAIRDGQVPVAIETRQGSSWAKVVEAIWRRGDVVVCNLRPGDSRRSRPSWQILNSALRVPIHLLSGAPAPSLPPGWLQFLSWAGNLALVVGFFWLQIRLARVPVEPERIVLLVVSVFLEGGALWVWNSLTA